MTARREAIDRAVASTSGRLVVTSWVQEAIVNGIEAGLDWKPEPAVPAEPWMRVTPGAVEAAAIAMFDRMKRGNLSHVPWYAASDAVQDEWRAAVRHGLGAAVAASAREDIR